MTLSTFTVIGILLFIASAIVLIAMMITRRPTRMGKHYNHENDNK